MNVAIKCPYCSTDVADDDQYCSSCGSRLVATSQLTVAPRAAVSTIPSLGYGAPPPFEDLTPSTAPVRETGVPTWLKVVLIVTGVLVVLAILGGALLYRWANSMGVEAQMSIPYPVFIGDCVTAEDGSGVVADCGDPHKYEVYHLFAWTGTNAYPDWAQSLDAGWETCQDAFDEYVGIAWIDSSYDYEVIAPPEPQWNDGERTMKCVLYDIFDGATVGSAMGSGR